MKKLRLLLFEKCNRSCSGCCNKQFDLTSLPECTDFSQYDEILLTGGEPMLEPWLVLDVMKEIRETSSVKIFVYTAWVRDLFASRAVMMLADGMTVSLHDQSDVQPFLAFASFCEDLDRSKRLNVFSGITIDEVPVGWKQKKDIVWIDPCPLPEDEVFMRLPRNTPAGVR